LIIETPGAYAMDMPLDTIDSRPAGFEEFAAELETQRGLLLVFLFDGREISAGFHITEVKAAEFHSIDCGGAPESWRETVIQLWDVDAPGAKHMTAGKFLAILDRASRDIGTDTAALLKFELGGCEGALRMYRVGRIAAGPERVTVELEPVIATCKPMFRGLSLAAPLPAASEGSAYCASRTTGRACCG
jgi:hypothetical protein